MNTTGQASRWQRRRLEKQRRIEAVQHLAQGPVLDPAASVPALEALIAPRDRVVIEGNNQKQADFLARSLAAVNPGTINDVHMVIPSVSLPEHLDLFEKGSY